MAGVGTIPKWAGALIREKFFKPCLLHECEKKSEKNTFCIDCCISLCPHCMPLHPNHNLLQIRRYVYQNVIRLREAQKLIDCFSIQPYTTNRAKVVFINHKPITHPCRGLGNACLECDRTLQDPYFFCSLSCKVLQMRKSSGVKKMNLTLDPIFERPVSEKSTSSDSSFSSSSSDDVAVTCISTVQFSKKKRSATRIFRTIGGSGSAKSGVEFSEALNRRKGVPRRSPLY